MQNFSDWLTARESSAFTRLRTASALGLMPDVPDASINSRSTAAPWEGERLAKKSKKKKKKKKKELSESKKPVAKDARIGSFVDKIGELKKEIDMLAKEIGKPKAKAIEKEKVEKPETPGKPEPKDQKKFGQFVKAQDTKKPEEKKPEEKKPEEKPAKEPEKN